MCYRKDLLYFAVAAMILTGGSVRVFSQTVTPLHEFCFTSGCPDAGGSVARLVQAPDGNFYGVAGSSEGYAASVIFRVSPAGGYTVMHSLVCNGCEFYGSFNGLTVGSDGALYGSTPFGGSSTCSDGGCGTIFRMTLDGSYSTLYQFCATGSCNAVGGGPIGNLTPASDGFLYGYTLEGIFKVSEQGSVSTLATFRANDCTYILIDDDLVQASNGALYSSSNFEQEGLSCESQDGFFEVSLDGQYTFLPGGIDSNLQGAPVELSSGALLVEGTYELTPGGTAQSFYEEDGSGPGLFLASDGNVYGDVQQQGSSGTGPVTDTIFQLSPSATQKVVTDLQGFPAAGSDAAQFTQGADGRLYSVTSMGGDYGAGAVFALTTDPPLAAPVQVSLGTATTEPGATETLTWHALNAFSLSMQQCYLFRYNGSAVSALGKLSGVLSNGKFGGSIPITIPDATGIYTYSVMCGGVESGFASVSTGDIKATVGVGVSAPASVSPGEKATITASVYATQNIGTVTGTVAFAADGQPLGTATVSGGAASLVVTVPSVPRGVYTITASYSGNSLYDAGSATALVTELGYNTQAVLSAEPATVVQGQTATLVATVGRVSSSVRVSGTVVFYASGVELGSASVTNGVAVLSGPVNSSIAPGTYALTADYSGDSYSQPVTSAAADITVLAATATAVSVSPSDAPINTIVTFSAAVKRQSSSGVPFGTVQFLADGQVFATGTLDAGGTASVNMSDYGIGAGKYSISAHYMGDSLDSVSTSAAATLEIQ